MGPQAGTPRFPEPMETRGRNPHFQNSRIIIHRYGSLVPGDRIVLVCAASAHRKAAIEACYFLIDWLKTKAPFWKCEKVANGNKWVEALDSDNKESSKWELKK